MDLHSQLAIGNRQLAITKRMAFVRVENGKIVEAWNNFDFMKMYRQLGAI
jgi:predicted ester cyclase